MSSFEKLYRDYRRDLLKSEGVDVGSWHSVKTKGNKLLITMELTWVSFDIKVPTAHSILISQIQPNNPWAEQHFQERVGGVPVNPPPSHVYWPWNHAKHQTLEGEKFSHTYPERMWPKNAGRPEGPFSYEGLPGNKGIRFEYGDLGDLVNLFVAEPYTRQGYIPIFFPEDTGGQTRLNERIPCSMGYHFMIRDDSAGMKIMDCMYTMRSCDFVRHFRDDIYMAARLLQWMCEQVTVDRLAAGVDRADIILPGKLRVNIASLHAMEGDRYKLTEEEKHGTR